MWCVQLHSKMGAHVSALSANDVVVLFCSTSLSLWRCGAGFVFARHFSSSLCSVVQHMRWNVLTPAVGGGMSSPLPRLVMRCLMPGLQDWCSHQVHQAGTSPCAFATPGTLGRHVCLYGKWSTCWCREGVSLLFTGPCWEVCMGTLGLVSQGPRVPPRRSACCGWWECAPR